MTARSFDIGHVKGEAPRDLRKRWKKVKKVAGIEDVRLHDLRHSFGGVAAGAGGSRPIIDKAMGHNFAQIDSSEDC